MREGADLSARASREKDAKHASRARIPILMYHGIVGDQDCGGPHTTRRAFLAQMEHLSRHDYRALPLGEALAALHAGAMPAKSVVLTFDDGYENFYSQAFPILARLGLTATVFVIAGFAGRRPSSAHPHAYMSLQQMREVLAAGMEVGSHSLTHPQLQRSPPERIDVELQHSRQFLEDGLGTAVRFFSYPYAFPAHDRPFRIYLRERLQHFGYCGAVSTLMGRAGLGSDPFLLPRLPVGRRDAVLCFAAKLQGACDWMRWVQWAHKRLRNTKGECWKAAAGQHSEA